MENTVESHEGRAGPVARSFVCSSTNLEVPRERRGERRERERERGGSCRVSAKAETKREGGKSGKGQKRRGKGGLYDRLAGPKDNQPWCIESHRKFRRSLKESNT